MQLEQVKNQTSKPMGYMKGFKDGIPIGLGYIPASMACGFAAVQSGIGAWMAQFMSMAIYTASGQLAAINLFSGGETAAIMYALTLLVMNCRYILFSITIAQKFDKSMGTLQRLGFGLLNTDEIFGFAMQQKGKLGASYLFGLATVPYLGFVIGNALGCFTTGLLPKSVLAALGIVVYAMFISVIVPPAKKSKPVLVVVLMALTLSAVLECIPVIKNALGSAWIIIICAVATSLIGAVLFPVEDKEEEE